ncbi:MAG: hypothetical protein QM770_15675 [Tepidisphaeraceae bacterium]
MDDWAAKGKPYLPWAAKPTDLPQAGIPAFPGAEGGGMYTVGGRGGKVYVVTSLDDHGPGTLREALEAVGPRVVVFNVAGIIRLDTSIRVRAPYVTLAGNTAPGDGVCVAGETVQIDTHDVVIRHMRFRRGIVDQSKRNDALGGNPVGNIMIDHVSASWGLDENLSMYRHMYAFPGTTQPSKLPTVNITIQHSISAEALNPYSHAFGSTIGGHNSTFHHNLFANNIARNPSVGMDGDFNFVNNVIYNWGHRSADGGDNNSTYQFINNYYKPGPATDTSKPIGHRILKAESRRGKDVPKDFGKAYVHGNVIEGNPAVTADNWADGVQLDDSDKGTDRPFAEVLREIRVDTPFKMSPLRIESAEDAYQSVLQQAGASLPKRDAVDERIVNEVRTGKPTFGKGIITDVSQVGGYPDYKGEPYADADHDGLPDAYESKHGLNANDPNDAALDTDGDGYTNIEEFINGTDPTAKVDYQDLSNNVDPRLPKQRGH